MGATTDMIRGRQTATRTLTNKSGGAVAAGDVVVIGDGSNDNSFTTTTTAAFNARMVGVAMEAIANDAAGLVAISGYVPKINTTGSGTRDRFLYTHTVAKEAADSATRTAGAFGQVLESGADPEAIIWGMPDPASVGASAMAQDELSPSSDTHIDSQNATTNYDTQTDMVIGNEWGTSSFSRFGLMTFDTSSLSGKTIVLAVLRLVRTDVLALTAVATKLQARRLIRAYVSAEATWNVYATASNWTTAGAQSAGNDVVAEVYDGPVLASSGLDNQIIRMDLTAMVKDDLGAASTTLRLILGMANADGSLNAITIAAKDHGTAAYRPILEVSYF